MVDPGEKVSLTVKREFMEEAVNALEKGPEELEIISKQLDKLFDHGVEVWVD
jgi:ADP-ribose pyrophosphatase